MKTLRTLLAGIAEVEDWKDREVCNLRLDSREVQHGDLFLAMPGQRHVDGRYYIWDAVRTGATAVVCDTGYPRHPELYNHQEEYDSDGESLNRRQAEVPYAGGTVLFKADDLNRYAGVIASRFFGHPSARMTCVGVTGTNGKTTCTYLLAQAFDKLGQRCALLGTLGAGFVGDLRSTYLTTSDAVSTHQYLARCFRDGARVACIEASSHGLAQDRLNGVDFDIALFTNLSQDHLDYHFTMMKYARAKQKLFKFDSLRYAVINADDPFGRRLIRHSCVANTLTYGILNGDVRAHSLPSDSRSTPPHRGLEFEVRYGNSAEVVRSPLIGTFNIFNLLAAIAVLLASGVDLANAAAIVSECTAPPGRMEWILPPKPDASVPSVVVDYAHTPDALRQAIKSLRQIVDTRGRVWVVFGCGGGRDVGKRSQMGKIADELANRVVLTDDNPRDENPAQIIADIAQGMKRRAEVYQCRRRAIQYTLTMADSTDIVLIAGRGHETAQITSDYLGQKSIPLDDREVAAKYLRRRSEGWRDRTL